MQSTLATAALLLSGLIANQPAVALDACKEGDKVKLEDGRTGVVSSVGAIGSCFLTLSDGSTAAAQPGQLTLMGASAPQFGPLKLGVYGCDSPQLGIRADVMIGLLDERNYRHFDGGQGRYRYDPKTAVLEITSGPVKGIRYRRFSETAFRVLEIDGDANTSTRCIFNPAKNVNKQPW